MIPNGHVNFYTDDEWIQMGTVNGQPIFRRTGSEMMRPKMTSWGGVNNRQYRTCPNKAMCDHF